MEHDGIIKATSPTSPKSIGARDQDTPFLLGQVTGPILLAGDTPIFGVAATA